MKDSVFRGQLRLLQTRRIFKKRDNGFHSHIAVRSILADDLIGAAGLAFPLVFEVNEDTFVTWPLDMLRREYEFSLNKVTFMDGKEVYEIDFSKTYYNENVKPRPVHKGKIFISSTDFAILRYEYSFPQAISKGYTKVIYKRYFDKYALFSIEKERNLAGKHVDHMIFQNTNITLGKSEEKYSNNISRAEIAKADYDPDFWNSYNGVKRNRLEETIVKNLNAESSMSTQEAFEEEQSEEYKIWREEERHGAIYDSLLENNQGLLCTIFWRSSHLYSKLVVSDYQKALNNIKILKAKGVRFVFVSLDYNHDLWKERIVKYGLENENHLRIGYNKKDKEAYHFENIVQLPQYQIHYKKRTIEYQAPPIYKDDFLSLIDKYLNKIDP